VSILYKKPWFWPTYTDGPVYTGEPSHKANPVSTLKSKQKIIERVAVMHGLTVHELKSSTRRHRISHARQQAMSELKARTSLSLGQIAHALNLKNHATVVYGIRAHNSRLREQMRGYQ